eukprot:758242-Hanusia_phi.AAC.2
MSNSVIRAALSCPSNALARARAQRRLRHESAAASASASEFGLLYCCRDCRRSSSSGRAHGERHKHPGLTAPSGFFLGETGRSSSLSSGISDGDMPIGSGAETSWMAANLSHARQAQVAWSAANIAAANDPSVNAGIAIDNALMGFSITSSSPTLTANMRVEQAGSKQMPGESKEVKDCSSERASCDQCCDSLQGLETSGQLNASGGAFAVEMLPGHQINDVSGEKVELR